MLQDLDDLAVSIMALGDELEFPFPSSADEVATMSVETCVEIKFRALHAVDALT